MIRSSAGERRPSDWSPGLKALINAADAMAPTLAIMLDAA
jgi:hypothetical protein